MPQKIMRWGGKAMNSAIVLCQIAHASCGQVANPFSKASNMMDCKYIPRSAHCPIKIFAVLEASGSVRLLQLRWIDVVFCFFAGSVDLHPLGYQRLEPFEFLAGQRPNVPGLKVAARRRTTGRQQDVL